jgi:hypothetical protein
MRQTWKKNQRPAALSAALALALAAPGVADEVCGDVNGDGYCRGEDLGWVLADYGCDDGDCVGDVDGDGDTDQADLHWVLMNLTCPDSVECLPCEPTGVGAMTIDLVPIDNTHVGPGDDPGNPEFHGGVTHFTFDLLVELTAEDNWTTQASVLELVADDLELFRHFHSNWLEPYHLLFGEWPALEFDTCYADPPALFDMTSPNHIEGPDYTPPFLRATWFNTVWDGESIATVQRITLVAPGDRGIVPSAMPDDCTHDYALLARLTTQATSIATGEEFQQGNFVIVDLAQPTCAGDVDMDGDVDQSDLGILLAAYHRPTDDPLFDRNADFDCDGDVDQSDLGTLLAVYGGDC